MITLTPMVPAGCGLVAQWNAPLSPEDLVLWAGEQAYQHPFTPEQMCARLELPGVCVYALREEGVLVGTVELLRSPPDSDRAVACRYFIRPDARGRGLGKQGLSLLCGAAAALGISHLTLRVYARNLPALQCYLACGFRLTQFHLREDAPIRTGYTMEREVTPA